MDKYLRNLAIEVLRNSPEGLSKVKFAKIIYFCHKELVRGGLIASNTLNFLRMPLGPVPNGFMELGALDEITVSEIPTSLIYNSQLYSLSDKSMSSYLNSTIVNSVKNTYSKIRKATTAELVKESHKEPSWINNPNGNHFVISKEDLERELKIFLRSSSKDEMSLQEQLVDGMMEDIVASSTSLEYPENDQ